MNDSREGSSGSRQMVTCCAVDSLITVVRLPYLLCDPAGRTDCEERRLIEVNQPLKAQFTVCHTYVSQNKQTEQLFLQQKSNVHI